MELDVVDDSSVVLVVLDDVGDSLVLVVLTVLELVVLGTGSSATTSFTKSSNRAAIVSASPVVRKMGPKTGGSRSRPECLYHAARWTDRAG